MLDNTIFTLGDISNYMQAHCICNYKFHHILKFLALYLWLQHRPDEIRHPKRPRKRYKKRMAVPVCEQPAHVVKDVAVENIMDQVKLMSAPVSAGGNSRDRKLSTLNDEETSFTLGTGELPH